MENAITEQKKKFVGSKELIVYLISLFLYNNMAQVIGNGMRNKYLLTIMEPRHVSTVNLVLGILGYFLPFVYAMVIDRTPKEGKAKFIPLITFSIIPAGIFTVLMFYTPGVLLNSGIVELMIIYQIVIAVAHGASHAFAGTIDKMSVVLTPDTQERDKIINFRGISSAISASAPLVVVAVVGLLKKPGILKGDQGVWLVTAIASSIVGVLMVLWGMRVVKERVTYSHQRKNPLVGLVDVIKNKYARILLYSEFLKNFRNVSNFVMIFLATVLLGDSTKMVLFGLPTGIGTAVGMIIVHAMLKKFNAKQIIMISGVYSLLANALTFGVGYLAFQHEGEPLYQILFFAALFPIGLQFGASNLLPHLFKADILEDLELKTHKRLESTLDFVTGLGSNVSGIIVNSIMPLVLSGAAAGIGAALNYIQYIQPVNGVEQLQTDSTKIRLLLFYTIGQGIFQLLCAFPFFFYKLTGKRKEVIHEQVLAYRESIAAEQEDEED
ncbi:MAG: MFS transporter [Oscillospiraceae bacterium]|nr:MFS transporter [Oscillospiraceae bacterium]